MLLRSPKHHCSNQGFWKQAVRGWFPQYSVHDKGTADTRLDQILLMLLLSRDRYKELLIQHELPIYEYYLHLHDRMFPAANKQLTNLRVYGSCSLMCKTGKQHRQKRLNSSCLRHKQPVSPHYSMRLISLLSYLRRLLYQPRHRQGTVSFLPLK